MSTGRTQALGSGTLAGRAIGYAYTASNVAVTTTNTIPTDNTIPQVGEGAELTAINTTYTPQFATSLLEVFVTIPWVSHGTLGITPTFAIFRDGAANAIWSGFAATPYAANALIAGPIIRIVVAAGSTSATTFTVRIGANSGTTRVLNNGSDLLSTADYMTMTVTEIAQ